MSIRAKASLAFAAVTLLCFALNATSLAPMSLAQMSHAADAIVRAKCVSNVVRSEEGEIWTFTRFHVEEIWKGEVNSQISVRLLGGSLGNITSHVSGVPKFVSGENVLLFLNRAPRGDYSVVGWVEGTFRISRDPGTGAEIVMQDSASFSVFNPKTRQFETVGVRRERLRDFRKSVISAIESDARSGE